ncbi:hypothetical protein HOP50_06g43580 [Chloropicon primus]|uniref:Galactose oxidase n=2 Tax=Chloropicon primus TaxID=1764295 RepID=A0A5B8MN42_9CHLO|nr:hypothetical protein A3770_06p43350 [Chloropicon primus]UPR01037.1 hypothetical protein HOP50_06g43580 [Chloropicon primus]|eukprot:QDZ21817.1 hypothetical protein A3770_06p43350 [Chloropicon primus]
MSGTTTTKSVSERGGGGGVLGELVDNGKLYNKWGKKGEEFSAGDHLTRLPRNLLGAILRKALESADGSPEDGREGARTLASLACACRALREILNPEAEDVPCDYLAGLGKHGGGTHHCHLMSSSGYPHSWYFDVEGYVRTDDLHAFTLGGKLWQVVCEQMLGKGICKLHATCGAYTDDLCRENAVFWRNLCRDAADLRILHWSKGANLVLKHNAKIEDGIMSKKKMVSDPELTKAQDLLTGSQASRCSIPGPIQTCFNSVLPEGAGVGGYEGSTSQSNRLSNVTPEERAEAERVLSSKWKNLSSTFLLGKRLPRSGHCAVSVGDFIVIVGGFCPAANLPFVDVILIHIETLTFRCPRVYGEPPAKRFRQTLNRVEVSTVSPLHPQRPDEHLLLMYGGWDALGYEYGGKEINTLTVAKNGEYVKWDVFDTLGQIPSPRYNHSAETIKQKESLFVYGGEGEEVEGNDTCCYFLNLNTLVWRRVPTFAKFKLGRKSHPRARCLHTSTVRLNPVSGLEEVIIFGGFSPSKDRVDSTRKNDIFDMTPFSLDLDTMQWTLHPQDNDMKPTSRQRAAPLRLSANKLLLVGGISEAGLFLDDVEQLNLTTLKWEEPPLILGHPSHGLRHVAGCSAEGLFIFGGTTTTIFGVSPVTKLDVLQIGPPHELEQKAIRVNDNKAGTGAGSPPKTPVHSPQSKSSFLDTINDFVTKLKLGRNKVSSAEWKFNNSRQSAHQLLARHRAARHSFS